MPVRGYGGEWIIKALDGRIITCPADTFSIIVYETPDA